MYYIHKMKFSEVFQNYGVLIILVVLIIFIFWLYLKTKSQNKPETYDPDNKKHKIILYYADWCGISQKFLPSWNEFEKQLNSTLGDKILASKIECEVNKDMCMNIPGFPSVLLHLIDGRVIQYKGDRTVKSLMEFTRSNI
jgi:hypothetical protein